MAMRAETEKKEKRGGPHGGAYEMRRSFGEADEQRV